MHNPSNHSLKNAQMDWRYSKGMWRVCEHGVGHPDPDHVEYEVTIRGGDRDAWSAHACDGCCEHQYDPEMWAATGKCRDYGEAKEIATLLFLNEIDWYYDQLEGMLYVRRGQYQTEPEAPKRKKKK